MTRMDRFELKETVGAGAMSTVYRAVDTSTGGTVAVKVLHPHVASAANTARFEREAHALAALRHRSIVGLKEFARGADGQPFSVLEFVDGQSLAQFVAREREVEPDLAAMILLELARATAFAHAKGVIHRDLKPENILVGYDGSLKVSDFGLAYLWEGTDLTQPGTRIGSPAYMSPEQIRGDKPSPAMDVFSLGILFYQMLTGELPFKGKGRRETFQQILDDTPPPPHRIHPAVPPELSDLGMDLLGKGRGRRIATADELITSIEAYLAGVGLTDYEPVLALYLADPKGNRDAVRREIVNGYLRVGKRAVERNERDRVFDLFRRVLYLTGVTVSGGHLSEEAQPTRKVILRERRFFWIWLGVVALVLAALFLVI